MAKVRMLTCIARADGVWDAGELYECDADEAKRLVAAGLAEPTAEARSEKRPAAATVEKRAA